VVDPTYLFSWLALPKEPHAPLLAGTQPTDWLRAQEADLL